MPRSQMAERETVHGSIAQEHVRASKLRAMDAVAGLLDGPRARGAFVLRSSMDPPWSLRIADEAPLTLIAIVHGGAWIAHDDAAPVRLGPGDVAIVLGPDPYPVADAPDTPPEAVIHPGGRCATPDGGELEAMTFV